MTTTKCEAKNTKTEHTPRDPHFFTVTNMLTGRKQTLCLQHAGEAEARGHRCELILT